MIFPFLHTPNLLSVENGRLKLTVDRATGLYSLAWKDQASITNVDAEARLTDGRTLRASTATTHDIAVKGIRDAFGRGTQVVVRHLTPGAPELRQTFRVDTRRPEVTVQLSLVGSTGSNRLTPVQTNAPKLAHRAPLRSLFVPWDNDNYFRYSSEGWAEGDGNDDGGYEVGALYDDATRQGLVVGSIDHDLWKTAVRIRRDAANEPASLTVFAGVTSKYTHDTQPHGTVTGNVVQSPRIVLGLFADWRDGLERYGDLNAVVRPPLAWRGAKPFFWSSWSGHKFKANAETGRYATDFIHTQLPHFRSGGTAYVNFDAGGGGMTLAQRREFIDHAHALGLKVGTYATPFACWSELDRPAGIGGVMWRDLVLKDEKGQPLAKVDGAYPLDATHPLVLALIDRNLKAMVDEGWDYVKMDFLSHGALEGRHHDPSVPTGTAAYNLGMRRIAVDLDPKRIGRPFFISESIAPLFPQGYAHSRRISCDVFANIGASEYLLNSSNYAFWEAGRLYRFSDPDSATVFQAEGEDSTTEAEARTRFVASVVSGGMMSLGDDLGKPEAQTRVRRLFGNPQALKIARDHTPFRPVEGDTGSRGGDLFVRRTVKAAYVACFNLDKAANRRRTIPLSRLGLSPGHWAIHDVLSGRELPVTSDLTVDLPPMDCALLRLETQKYSVEHPSHRRSRDG